MKILDMIAAKSDRNDKTKWLPYKTHAIDTAGIIGLLFDRWLSEAARRYITTSLAIGVDYEDSEYKAKMFCQLIALFHDIGKITPAFQSKISTNIENYTDKLSNCGLKISGISEVSKSPHDVAGQAILEELGASKEVAAIVGAHHGNIEKNHAKQFEAFSSNYFGYKCLQEQQWRCMWNEWVEYSLKETGWTAVHQLPKPNVKVQMILTGLLIMSDWIASNTEYFPYIDIDTIVEKETHKNRLKYAWTKLDLPSSWNAEAIYDQPDFFRERFSFEPNTVQQTVMETVSRNCKTGIYIIEAPMGIGKTEAALAAAELLAFQSKAGGIYFGLPTQATANGIFGRIRDWAKERDTESHTIRLAHGMTDLNEEYQELFRGTASDSGDSGIIVHEWFEGRKQALLADFVVATIDQFLLASLKQKHVMLRHLGLAGKVVIIDECHSYDAYMNVYLDHTLTWMGAYDVPVIILSATLPPQRRNELIKAYQNNSKNIEVSFGESNPVYPVITWTSGNEIMQTSVDSGIPDKHITVTEIDETDLASMLSQCLSDGGCAAVIVNTVEYAQELSKRLSEYMNGYIVICFHSRFTAADRAAIEKKLLTIVGKSSTEKDRNKLIIVGTQVLEQSLDLDFDFMVTQLCPMDLLLQRSGRLHRHERKRPDKLSKAQLAILRPADDKSSMIYSEWILKRTAKYLPEKLVIPSCIPHLVSQVYAEPENDEERFSDEWQKYQKVISDKKTKAKKYCITSNMLRTSFYSSLADYLDKGVENSAEAEASVRDTEETVEVIVLQRKTECSYCLPGLAYESSFDTTIPLSNEEARLIAVQRLKLPLYFSKFRYNDTKNELDVMPKSWRESKWLKGELLLLLNENCEAELVGKKLRYSKQRGLESITV